jgi:molybdopterin-containing oxidoreductase family membrane subunit
VVFVSVWIDKGAGMLTGGFVPSPLGRVPAYFPPWPEIVMGAGLYSFGALVLILLYRVVVSVREQV